METAEQANGQSAKQNFSRRYFETMRRTEALENLGRTAIRAYQYDELKNYEQRQYDEVFSAFVEGLKGAVSSHYTFEMADGKLVAKDGEDIEQLLWRGLDDANELSARDKFYADFLPQRAGAELNEHLENLSMASGRAAYNTNIRFSPYSEEFDTSEENAEKLRRAAQKPYFKRAMLRVSHWDGSRLHVFTRSIDNSSVPLLRQVAKESLGYDFDAGNSNEMIAEGIHLNLAGSEWAELPDQIISTADKILYRPENLGTRCIQGRPAGEAESLHDFVTQNSAVVEHLLQTGRELALEHDDFNDYKKMFESEFYNHIALLEKRLEQGAAGKIEDVKTASAAAGAIAQSEGKSYDLCGQVLSANSNTSTAAQTGFESLSRLEGKKVSCPECKSKVVVPKSDLEKGHLTCGDCGFGVDVCTGKVFKRPKKSKNQTRYPDFFERLSADLKKYDEQIKARQDIERQNKKRKERLAKQAQAAS